MFSLKPIIVTFKVMPPPPLCTACQAACSVLAPAVSPVCVAVLTGGGEGEGGSEQVTVYSYIRKPKAGAARTNKEYDNPVQ